MKKLTAALTALAAAFTMMSSIPAGAVDWSGTYEETENGGYELVSWERNDEYYDIPVYKDGKLVTGIQTGAIKNCPKTKSYFVPETVTDIDPKSLGYASDKKGNLRKQKGIKIFVESKESAAWKYAKENGFDIGYYKAELTSKLTNLGDIDDITAYLDENGIAYKMITDGYDNKQYFELFRCIDELVNDPNSDYNYYAEELYASEYNGMLYYEEDGAAYIAGLTEYKSSYVIPDTINGLPVKGIAPVTSAVRGYIQESGEVVSFSYGGDNCFMAAFEFPDSIEHKTKVILPKGCTKVMLERRFHMDRDSDEPYLNFGMIEDYHYSNTFFYYKDSECEAAVNDSVENDYLREYYYHELMYGDVDFDDKINVTDLSKVAAHVKTVKTLDEGGLITADTSGDGKITVTDLSQIAANVKTLKTINR